MFFTRILEHSKQKEWDNLISTTDFLKLWKKFKGDNTAENFIESIKYLIDLIKSKQAVISDDLRDNILQQLNDELDKVEVNDIKLLAIKYSKKFNYESQVINYIQQKRSVIYQVGEKSLAGSNNLKQQQLTKPSLGLSATKFFNECKPGFRQLYIASMLGGGFGFLNEMAHNAETIEEKTFLLFLQIAWVTYTTKTSDDFSSEKNEFFDDKEKIEVIDGQINILKQKLMKIDSSISILSITSDNNRHKLNLVH